MKQLLSLCLSALLALSLAACGSDAPTTADHSAAPGGSDAAVSDTASASEAAASEPAASVTEPASAAPQVDFKPGSLEFHNEKNDEDSAVVMRSEWQTPTVTVPGNEQAQKAIQDDLDQLKNSFHTYTEEGLTAARDAYADFSGEGEFPVYFHGLRFQVARCDSAVLSLIVDESGYDGGAHGYTNRTALNYDAATGKKLTLDEVGQEIDPVATETVTRFVKAVRDRDGIFFDDLSEENLREVVSDDTFYFDENGMTFISGQYLLQPYAAGIITFTVSYDELAGKLKEQYNPGGGRTRCATAETVYTFDGDGALQAEPNPETNPET